jgi:hypothetical protein
MEKQYNADSAQSSETKFTPRMFAGFCSLALPRSGG